MDAIQNPFRPRAGTPPPVMIVRDELVAHSAIASQRAARCVPGQSLLAVGLRGVGKTVLLIKFVDQAGVYGLKAAFVEAPEGGTLPVLVARELRRILLQLDAMEKAAALTKKALRVLK